MLLLLTDDDDVTSLVPVNKLLYQLIVTILTDDDGASLLPVNKFTLLLILRRLYDVNTVVMVTWLHHHYDNNTYIFFDKPHCCYGNCHPGDQGKSLAWSSKHVNTNCHYSEHSGRHAHTYSNTITIS